jgi:two-component system chemotaxis response regulator CheY
MKLKALVIDDSRVMRNMVMQSLNKTRLAEFEFLEAEDGEDALAKFDADNIDVAFVDWNMPRMTGIDFVRKVRALGNTDHIAMVMVTSEKTMGKIEEALDEAGANAYICKPFTAEDLVRKLQPLFEEIAASRGESGSETFLDRLFG